MINNIHIILDSNDNPNHFFVQNHINEIVSLKNAETSTKYNINEDCLTEKTDKRFSNKSKFIFNFTENPSIPDINLSDYDYRVYLLTYDDITDEKLDCIKKYNYNIILTDTLPDEVVQSISDENFLFFVESFIFLKPDKIVFGEQSTNFILFIEDTVQNKDNYLLKILKHELSKKEETKSVEAHEFFRSGLNKRPKRILLHSSNPNHINSILLSHENVSISSHDTLFSPLRYLMYGAELKNDEDFMFYNSSLREKFKNLSKNIVFENPIKKSQANNTTLIDRILTQDRFDGLKFNQNILSSCYLSRITDDGLNTDTSLTSWLNNKRVLPIIDSLYDETNIESRNHEALEKFIQSKVFSDKNYKYKRTFISNSIKKSNFVNKFFSNAYKHKSNFLLTNFDKTIKAFFRFSLESIVYNKFLHGKLIADFPFELLTNNISNQKSDLSSLLLLNSCKSFYDNDLCVNEFISKSNDPFTLNQLLIQAFILALCGELKDAVDLLTKLNLKSKSNFLNDEVLFTLELLDLFPELTPILESDVPKNNSHYKNAVSTSKFLQFPFFLVFPNSPDPKHRIFLYHLYRHLQNASTLDFASLDHLFSFKNKNISEDKLVFLIENLSTFMGQRLRDFSHDKMLPPFLCE